MGQIQSQVAHKVSSQLPKFLQLLIDAHGSDVPLVSLYLFTPFARSIHQLPRHNPTPLLHSPLQRTEMALAEALRMTAYQPIEQFRGCGVELDADLNASVNILKRAMAGGNLPAAALDAA